MMYRLTSVAVLAVAFQTQVQSTPTPVTHSGDGVHFAASNAIAVISLLVTTGIAIYGWHFQRRVQENQGVWQRRMEEQRQKERAEDVARAEAAITPRIETEVAHVQIYSRILVPEQAYLAFSEELEEHTYLQIRAKNLGQVKLQLGRPHLELPDGNGVYVDPAHLPEEPDCATHFPTVLDPHRSMNVYVLASDLAESLQKYGLRESVQLVGVYKDAIDNEYRSSPYTFDLTQDWSPQTIASKDVDLEIGNGDSHQ